MRDNPRVVRTAQDDIVVEVTRGRARSWSELIDRWIKVVDAIEDEYSFTIYDYRNDLDDRSLIEDVLTACRRRGLQPPDHERKRLAAADDRFRQATRETHTQLATRDLGFWANRIPLRLGAELARDVKAENL
jgi:hypothetical protein